MKKIKVGKIIWILAALFLLWFFIFRTKELLVTYDSVDPALSTMTYGSAKKSMARNEAMYMAETAAADMGMSNALSTAPLYDESLLEGSAAGGERYRENKYYRTDTQNFDSLIEDLYNVIKELNGTIKINQQNSNKKTVFDKEFYPRYQELEFTVDNSETNLDKIEEVFKKWGEIRVSNSNITSIEQELINYEQQLKEMEEARKALQESKDKDWIARQDSELAKQSERIKNQIENAKKQSEYKTYHVDIYEVIKYRVNAIVYWYSNNYSLKNAISEVLPGMIRLFATLIPIAVMVLVLLVGFLSLYRGYRQKMFKDKIDILKNEFKDENIHFDIKM